MLVLSGLIASLIVALIISKILNRKFYPIWLCVLVTMWAIMISFLTIVTIIDFGVTNESMLCLITAVLGWISSVTIWRAKYV